MRSILRREDGSYVCGNYEWNRIASGIQRYLVHGYQELDTPPPPGTTIEFVEGTEHKTVIGHAEIKLVLPIVGPRPFGGGIWHAPEGQFVMRAGQSLSLYNGCQRLYDMSDQIPYAEWYPGLWAWLIEPVHTGSCCGGVETDSEAVHWTHA